ncbi:MAG: putative ABC exporter domain-containing protein [Planctomycetota bacterium]
MRLKLRGIVRKQLRRLKTPSGLVLTLVGGSLFALWIGSLLLNWILGSSEPSDPEVVRPFVRLGALMMTTLTLSSSLAHRGLFVPREEIERLFSAPLSRSDLIRYRLAVNLGRGAFGGIVLGLVVIRHLPNPLFGFLATFVALETLPVIGQMAAILSGALERRAYGRLKGLQAASIPLAILIGGGVFLLAVGGDGAFGDTVRSFTGEGGLTALTQHPLVRAITLPFAPWANAATATSASDFLLWMGVSLGIWFTLFELAARLPVDFRELSLETAANVAERIRRARRTGGGAAASKVTKSVVGLRIPWLLGRTPMGAVAWRKCGAIVRKARGTLLVTLVVLAFVTFIGNAAFADGHDDEERMFGAVVVAMLSLFYLAGGLRFDFRDELDRMEAIKAWPLSPARLFVAMLLPEVALVSVLAAVPVFASALLSNGVEWFVVALLLTLPLLAFAWVSLDNAVFLLMPVRMVPGQEGALQNAGRSILLFFLRGILITTVGGCAFVGGFLVHRLVLELWGGERQALVAGAAVGWLVLLAADFLLVLFGAWTFRRFDVARDRG